MTTTAVLRSYRIRLANIGALEVEGSVHTTFPLSTLAELPEIPSALVRPAQGRTESKSWTARIVDVDGILTSVLGVNGRLALHGRLIDCQMSENGGAFTTIATGRVMDISEASQPGVYSLNVTDERLIERETQIWTNANTTAFYPPGPRWPWAGNFNASPTCTALLRRNGWYAHDLTSIQQGLLYNPRWPSSVIELMRSEIHAPFANPAETQDLANSIRLLVYRGPGVPPSIHQVGYFGSMLNPTSALDLIPTLEDSNNYFAIGFDPYPVPGSPNTDPLDDWAEYRDEEWLDVQLYLEGHPASSANPLHVGTAPAVGSQLKGLPSAMHAYGGTEGGIHPFALVKQLYDENGIRYDATALQTLINDTSYPLMRWRITEPAYLGQWLEDNIYGPLQVVPFINGEGKIAPRSVRLPTNLTSDQADALFQFNSGNSREVPTFQSAGQELVNFITFTFKRSRLLSVETGGHGGVHAFARQLYLHGDEIDSTDLIIESRGFKSKRYAQSNIKENRSLTYQLEGFIVNPWSWANGYSPYRLPGSMEALMAQIAQDTFDRFGDGAQTGTLEGMLSTKSVQPGDLVRINFSSYPNTTNNVRGGERIVQILSKDIKVDGYRFDYIDVGARLQPLGTPVLALSLSTETPRHVVNVAVSGFPVGVNGSTVVVEYAVNGTNKWQVARVVEAPGTYAVPNLPSGTSIAFRAKAMAPGRIRSGWSIPVVIATTALPAPTGVDADEITPLLFEVSWTNTIMTYPVEVLVAPGTVAPNPWTLDHRASGLLPEGSATVELSEGFAANSSYVIGVRYRDQFGGVSPVAVAAPITTGSLLPGAPRPAGLVVYQESV